MVKALIHRLHREVTNFRNLPQNARRLMVSYFLLGATNPILSTFVNAYLWRSQQNVTTIVLYNLGNFLALPLMFALNGKLLTKFPLNRMYLFGTATIGFGSLLVVFLHSTYLPVYLIYGFIYGAGNGLYWANRNYLTQVETVSENRNYFVGLSFSLDIFTSVVVPVVIGWFIYLLSMNRFGSLTEGYQISMVLAFMLLITSGLIIQKSTFTAVPNLTLGLGNLTKRWLAVRVVMVAIGLSEGILYFFPTILILMRLGHEQILGTITGATSLFTGLVMYTYGRKAELKHRGPYFVGSLILTVIAAVFALPDNRISLLCYLTLAYLAIYSVWLGAEPHMMDIVDEQVHAGHFPRYALIFDRELFLNIGRVLSIAVFIGLYVWNRSIGLHWAPLLTTLFSSLLVMSVWKNFKSR